MDGILVQRLMRRFAAGLLLGGTALLVYNKRIGLTDPNGIAVGQLLLRPELWFGVAVITALVAMPRSCFRLVPAPKNARRVLRTGPVVAFVSAVLGSLLSWWRFGIGMNLFGVQICVRMVLCALLAILTYNLAGRSRQFAHRLSALLVWAPAVNVLVGLGFLASPAIIAAIFGPQMILEAQGVLDYGSRYQGLTSNPDMVATSSCVAMALLLPGFLRDISRARPFAIIKGIYMLGLASVIAWSGVRASVVILLLVCAATLGLSFRFTKRGLMRFGYIACALAIIMILGLLIIWRIGAMDIILERFHSGNGRLFLWIFYGRTLLHNPLGLGFGYESIVHTDQIIPGQRLPPHNTFLEMAMYGGWIGLFIHALVLWWTLRWIGRVREKHGRSSPLPVRLQSLILGWLANIASLFFAGLIFVDPYYTIITALLLAELGRAAAAGSVHQPAKVESLVVPHPT